MKVVRIAVKIGAGVLGLLFLLFVAYFIWGNFITDEFYRQGMEDSGNEKVVIYDMRAYFHGKTTYEPFSFEDLHKKGILSDTGYDYIKSSWFSYYPFSPQTPDNAVVLRFGPPFIGEVLHKGDFTAGQNDPDIVVR